MRPGHPLTESDPRRLLAEERRRTDAMLAALVADHDSIVAASRDSNADDEHDPEGATIAFERSQVASMVRRAEAHLSEVTAAEQRLATGTYGTCERCGAAVAPARLAARPAARDCVRCASSR